MEILRSNRKRIYISPMKRLLPIIAILLTLAGCKKEKPFNIYDNIYYTVNSNILNNTDPNFAIGLVINVDHTEYKLAEMCEYRMGDVQQYRSNCVLLDYNLKPTKDGKIEINFKGFTADGHVGNIPKNTEINETVIIDPNSTDQSFTMFGFEFKRYLGAESKYSH